MSEAALKYNQCPCVRCGEPFVSCMCEPSICGRGDNEVGCGQDIWFVRTANRRTMPVNKDGTSHFTSCPKASNF